MMRTIFILWLCGVIGSAMGELIKDPIKDHLETMNEGRVELSEGIERLSEFVRVSVWEVDVDSDGVPETFVGHTRPWTGDDTVHYWTVYQKKGDQFLKISAPDSDLRIPFRIQGGFFYVGSLKSLKKKGIVTVDEEERSKPRLFRVSQVLDIQNGQLVVEERGPVDEESEEGRTFLRDYLDQPPSPSNPIQIVEMLSGDDLTKKGYNVAIWDSYRDSLAGLSPSLTGYQKPETTKGRGWATFAGGFTLACFLAAICGVWRGME